MAGGTFTPSQRRKMRVPGRSLAQALWMDNPLTQPYLLPEDEEPDYSWCTFPDRMNREQALREVFLPLAREGRTEHDEAWWARWAMSERVKIEAVRQRAGELLRENPWPPGLALPPFWEFVESEAYIGRMVLSPFQRWCVEESLGVDAWDWFVKPRRYTMLVWMWGKGAGKDSVASAILSYACWCVSQMRNPWFHFRMAWGDPLDCINVAQNADVAATAFFARVKWNLQRPCFAQLIDVDRDLHGSDAVFRRRVPGNAGLTDLLRLRSMNSFARSVEGANTFLWNADETDELKDLSGNDRARAMIRSLRTSSRGWQVGISFSYPRGENGYQTELLEQCANVSEGEGVKKRYNWWGVRATTPQVLPFKCYVPDQVDPQGAPVDGTVWRNPESGWDSTMPGALVDQNMYDTWKHDPEDFQEVYLCRPRPASGAWLTAPHIVDDAVKPWLEPAAVARPYVSRREERGLVREFAALLVERLYERPGVRYQAGVDFGLDDASLALCIMHAVPAREEGYLSPEGYADPKLRRRKHYRPEPVPVDARGAPLVGEDGQPLFPERLGWRPEDWRCEETGRTPVPGQDLWWGVCAPQGRSFERQAILRYTEDGSPVVQRDEDGNPVVERLHLPGVVEDALFEWRPDGARRRQVDLLSVRDAVRALHAGGQITCLRADQWQAEMMIQELCSEGIQAETVNMSAPEQWRIYEGLRTLLSEGLVELLPCADPGEGDRACGLCPPCRARRQLKELVRKNNRIDKPDYSRGGGKGRKDLTDAEAIAADLCVQAWRNTPYVATSRHGQRGHEELASSGRRRAEAGRSLMRSLLTGRGFPGDRRKPS